MKEKLEHDRHIGLARAISKLGYCSRSRALELIRAGRVQLNGKLCRNPEAPTREEKDRIAIDGKLLERPGQIYLALNKPRGIVTTAADEKGRETIYSLLPSDLPWLAPVGRLDKASEGLLLLTNDSEWAAKITDPASHLEKTYHVQISALADRSLLQNLERGIRDKAGEHLQMKHARVLRGGEKNTWLEIVLDEGKNRHIRRMFAALEIEVPRLVRVAIGSLTLGNLEKGKSRALTKEEKILLDRELSGRKN